MYQTFAVVRKFLPALRQFFDDVLECLNLVAVELKLAVAVVHKEDAWSEPHLTRNRYYFLRFFGGGGTNYSADSDLETSVLFKRLKALLQIVEDLLWGFVGVHAVDRNLYLLKSGFIELFDQLRPQEEAVGDHTGAKKTKLATFTNEAGKFRVQRWLTASQ